MPLATPLSEQGQSVLGFIQTMQPTLCHGLAAYDTASFQTDHWERGPNEGGGVSCIIEKGSCFEKGGVNISAITGTLTQPSEQEMFKRLLAQRQTPVTTLDNARYFATGLSLVLHPNNPFIPTVHLNYRYFELQTASQWLWWTGGGSDITPYFLDTDIIRHFHRTLKDATDSVDPALYPTYKPACDRYFYLPHRKEHRGMGGIFFDYGHTQPFPYYDSLIQACLEAFLPAYTPSITQHQHTPYSPSDRAWQCYRRGRYVEFNLLHDRGTLFGLKTNGRIESIFMSLPPEVSWTYNETNLHKTHTAFLDIIAQPIDWV